LINHYYFCYPIIEVEGLSNLHGVVDPSGRWVTWLLKLEVAVCVRGLQYVLSLMLYCWQYQGWVKCVIEVMKD